MPSRAALSGPFAIWSPCALRSGAGRVAASTRTRHLVAGPRRAGTVLGVFPTAVYVGFRASAGDEVMVVETADGLRLPRAATLAATSAEGPLRAVRAGDDAYVGDGRLSAGPLALDVVRWWSPRPPRIMTSPAYDARLHAVSRLTPALPAELERRLGSLVASLTASQDTSDGSGLAAATTALLGLGDGLTPQGDDVLAGLLVTLHAATATRPMACRLGDVGGRPGCGPHDHVERRLAARRRRRLCGAGTGRSRRRAARDGTCGPDRKTDHPPDARRRRRTVARRWAHVRRRARARCACRRPAARDDARSRGRCPDIERAHGRGART